MGRAPRIMLYSHDTLGFGHIRRNLLIAETLSQMTPAPEILMVGGMREAGSFVLPEGVDCVTLPAYAKGVDGKYQPRDLGTDLDRLADLRSQMIHATTMAFAPDLLIVDNVPRGAQFELDRTLKALSKQGRTRIVLGLRDVIDRPQNVRRQWLRQRNFETVRRYFDAVWIYGDPAFYDLLSDCGMENAFGTASIYTGYLDPAARRGTPQAIMERTTVLGDDTRPYVFCAVGGGRDGAALAESFARARLPDGHRGILVTGSQMPAEQQARIAKFTSNRTDMTVLPFLREPIDLMAGASRIVGMGGYNTTCEILSLGRPSLIVPRVAPREEQLIRTSRLAADGAVSMIHPDRLTPDRLSAWLADPQPVPATGQPDMRGLTKVRALAEDLVHFPTNMERAS